MRGDWTEGAEYFQLIYGRGPLVLRMLHSLLGEDKFFLVLHNVVTKYAHKSLSTEDFARETSAVAGQDMSWFFKQWIQEPGVPDLYITQSIVHEGGKTFVAGHVRQQDRAHFKVLILPFVYSVGGQRAAKLVVMDKPDMDFKAELAPGAQDVVLDPGKSLLAYVH
jgi:aminopeptidase N